jgi:dihydroorotate dehydrogenase
VAIKGPNVFKSIKRGINAYLKKRGLKGVKEIVGLSHRG